jgi:hypothetical protein
MRPQMAGVVVMEVHRSMTVASMADPPLDRPRNATRLLHPLQEINHHSSSSSRRITTTTVAIMRHHHRRGQWWWRPRPLVLLPRRRP